jgi:signal transduction histidine kinase
MYAGTIDEKGSLIILNDPEQEYKPGKRVLLFEDKSGELNFRQIQLLKSSFKPNHTNSINPGTTSSAIWCMLKLRNQTNEKWYLEIGEPYIDYIDLYSIDQEGNTKVIKTGLLRSFKQRSIKVNHYIIPLNLGPDEEKTYYIRARSYTILKVPLIINTIQNHFETNHREDLANGIYFGLIFALSLYNLFVFLLLKDKTYLYYVFYINFLGATIAWLRGYSPEFLNAIPLNLNHGNNYAALTFIFLALFTHSFLNLEKTLPKHKWLIALFFAVSIATLVFTISGRFDLGFYFVLLIVTINLPYIAFFGIYALKKGFRPAAFYILGFTFFTLGDFIFMLSENAKIHQTLLGNYSLQIGSSLEAIILSFALANKLNIFKKEKEETQAQALAQANEFTKELIRTQEEERKRIAGELHDSVGQSLSLLKNRITMLKKDLGKQPSLDELNELVSNTIQEIRSITYGLRPFQLDLLGLTQSLKSLTEGVAEAGEIKFQTKIDNIDGLVSREAEIYIFRIVQECLNNISKHSHASEALVEIKNPADKINIVIEDNGIGIEKKPNGNGFGIIGIKERVTILNGKLEIISNEPKGTKIRIQI